MYISEKKLSLFILVSYLLIYCSYIFHVPFMDDSLELVSVASVIGIAHPTGYPLYTVLGAVWLRLTPFLNPYFSMSLMTLLFSVVSFFIMYALLKKWFTMLPAVILTAFLFANSQLLFISMRPEVYSLHFLFLVILLYVLFSSMPVSRKLLYVLFIQGLALTNHVTSLFFIFIWLPFILKHRKKWVPSQLGKAVIAALIPVVVLYLYLPVASSFNPPINWGNPSTWEGFWWLVTGGDYSDSYLLRPFTGSLLYPDYWTALSNHFRHVMGSFLPNIFFFALLIYLFIRLVPRDEWKKCLFRPNTMGLGLYSLVLLVFMLHYKIPNIYEYFPLLFAALLVLVLSMAPSRQFFPKKHILIVGCLVVVTFALSQREIPYTDQYPLIEESVQALPEDSIVLTQGDIIYGFWYMKYALDKRPDLTYVGANFINYPWYDTFFERNNNIELKTFEGWEIDEREWVERVIKGVLEPNKDRQIFLFLPDPILTHYIHTAEFQKEDHHVQFWEVTGWDVP